MASFYPIQSLLHVLFMFKYEFMSDIQMDDIIPISDFVRNASEHAARIRKTKRAEILTQHGRPSLAVMPAEEYETLMGAKDYLDSVEAIRIGLQAAEDGELRPAEDVIKEWEAL
jgi:prevent-host-death family protein